MRFITAMQSAPGPGALSVSPRTHLLALHGWRTSASVLAQQLKKSGLDAALDEAADVACLDAPHAARGPPTPDVQRTFQPPFFEWWDAVQDAGGALTYAGAEQSLELVEDELRNAAARGRPVSGLVGFSQGATLAALVVALQERGERFQDVPPLRCAVLIAGGIVRDPAFARLYGSAAAATAGTAGAAGAAGEHPQLGQNEAAATTSPAQQQQPQLTPSPAVLPLLSRPSCHLVGSADPMQGHSDKLAERFAEPLVLRHDQGHVVPRLPPEQRERLAAFLRAHLQQQQQ